MPKGWRGRRCGRRCGRGAGAGEAIQRRNGRLRRPSSGSAVPAPASAVPASAAPASTAPASAAPASAPPVHPAAAPPTPGRDQAEIARRDPGEISAAANRLAQLQSVEAMLACEGSSALCEQGGEHHGSQSCEGREGCCEGPSSLRLPHCSLMLPASPGLVDDRCDLHLTRSHSAESSSPRCDLRLSRSVSAETSTSAHSTVQSSVRSSSSAAAPAPPTPTAPPPSPRAASPRASRYLGLGSLTLLRQKPRATDDRERPRSLHLYEVAAEIAEIREIGALMGEMSRDRHVRRTFQRRAARAR